MYSGLILLVGLCLLGAVITYLYRTHGPGK